MPPQNQKTRAKPYIRPMGPFCKENVCTKNAQLEYLAENQYRNTMSEQKQSHAGEICEIAQISIYYLK